MVSAILATGISCFAAALFAQAGWGKLTKPAAYVETVAAYTGRPATAFWVVAIGVSELLLALALLLPASRMWGVVAGGASSVPVCRCHDATGPAGAGGFKVWL